MRDIPVMNEPFEPSFEGETTMGLYITRLLILHISYKMEHGLDLRQENSIAKNYIAHMLHNIVDTAIQIHGSLGYTLDTPLAHWYTEARQQRLVDGPDKVHKWTVGRNVVRAYQKFGTTASATGGDLFRPGSGRQPSAQPPARVVMPSVFVIVERCYVSRRLAGKMVVVTGAASGLGRAIVARFVAEGAVVVAGDVVNPDRAVPQGSSPRSVLPVPCDVTDLYATAALIGRCRQEHGRLDVVVNSAGVSQLQPVRLHELDPADWERVISTNLRGPAPMTHPRAAFSC